MFSRLLVANRGEIARRIFRTARSMGLTTVGIFSDPDRDLPFVDEADLSVSIGGAAAGESYLDVAKVLDAAKRAGAEAIHPGYGFLSENAAFAQAVVDAGFVWIGPPAAAIRAVGDKAAARRLAGQVGVPVVPGYDGEAQSDEVLLDKARHIGLPLLVKASAGGGGRGQRRVYRWEELPEALVGARRESAASFADDRLLLERLVERPRHIEVQVLADHHGNFAHLYERECSIQRRNQKIFEEAPSAAVSPAMREALGDAALRIARGAGYRNAGTCEFLVEPDGKFWFLEMNTRLQVEHPVTELVTGLDLVELQLRCAMGEPLPFGQPEVRLYGHAIEARVVAEDPNRDFLPGTGRLLRLDLPEGDHVRVDAGVSSGSEIGIHYDAMVAKVIAWGPNRALASQRLRRALDQSWMPGVVSNLPLLREILAHPAWLKAELHTAFLGDHALPTAPPLNPVQGALAAALWGALSARRDHAWGDDVPLGFSLFGPAAVRDRLRIGPHEASLSWRADGKAIVVEVALDGGPAETHRLVVRGQDGDAVRVEVDGIASTWRIASTGGPAFGDGDTLYVHFGQGESYAQMIPRFPAPKGAEVAPGSAVAPSPGKVVQVHVAVGDVVVAGQRLLTLEAMKMEHSVTAPSDGVVAEVRVVVGEAVDAGVLLVRIEDVG